MKDRIAGTRVLSQAPQAFIRDFQVTAHLQEVTALKYCHDRLGLLIRTLQVSDVDEFTPLTKVVTFASLVGTYAEGFTVLFEPFDDNGLPDARLQLCCVDAALAIRPVFEKFRSVVITSGTMSPLDMYPKMLNFTPSVAESFTMSLARAVVAPLIVTKGADQNPMSSRFSAREDPTVAVNYGNLVLSLARSVPDGIVVFFTSYSYLEHMVEAWSQPDTKSSRGGGSDSGSGSSSSIMQRILQHKLVFLETKDIEETSLALAAYKKACACGRGAVFMSVARGKVAEGIDFSGHLGRAVVLIGVPFQYTRSRVLLARLEFLRAKHNIEDADFLNFDALRQASQCVGRIVRSKNDYGLMIFADQRYSRSDKRAKLPRWIQQFMLPENLNLSSESALHVARNFLKTMAMPHDRKNEIGVTLLDEENVRRFFAAQPLLRHADAVTASSSTSSSSSSSSSRAPVISMPSIQSLTQTQVGRGAAAAASTSTSGVKTEPTTTSLSTTTEEEISNSSSSNGGTHHVAAVKLEPSVASASSAMQQMGDKP